MAAPVPATDFTIETDFEIDEEAGSTLGPIQHTPGEVNRVKVTSDWVRNTRFWTTLSTVQYGTYTLEQADGTTAPVPAALLVFRFNFDFMDATPRRITAVRIEVDFRAVLNGSLDKPPVADPGNDPQVRFISPYQMYGTPTVVDRKQGWKFEGKLDYPVPLGPTVGVAPSRHADESFQRRRQLSIRGSTDGDNEHRHDNKAVWTMQENRKEASGVIPCLPGAVVIVLPGEPAYPVQARVKVVPHLAFPIGPRRLLQNRHDPIFLDRTRNWGPQYAPQRDFSDPEYPWADIIRIPTERQDILHDTV